MESASILPEKTEVNTKKNKSSISSEALRGSHDRLDHGDDMLLDRQCDDSVEQVSNQLKDKLGVKAGHDKNASRPPNGCWLGMNLNGENGFTKLESCKTWPHEIRDMKNNDVLGPTFASSPPLQLKNADENPSVCRVSSMKHEELITTTATIAASTTTTTITTLTSPESDQGYGKSPETDVNNEFVNDDVKNIEHSCKSGDVVLGPFNYSYVSLEKSNPVAVVRPKPKVHVANSVIASTTTATIATTAVTAATPFSSLPTVTSLSTYSNSDTNLADEIRYVAYESELQMPDIMRLIQKDLSEPYSIYTYRYFIHNWPKLCFLAMHGEKCVGAIVCKLDLHKKVVRRGYIAMLAVDENYRKRKIGSNLVLKAIQAMVVDDADEVVLETEISNKPALRLYENLGFVRDKRLFRYYLNGVDALRLKLWLR